MAILSSQVAVVAGGSRGIGRAVAAKLGALGASVVVNYVKDVASARAVVVDIEKQGGKGVAVQADMSKRTARGVSWAFRDSSNGATLRDGGAARS